MVFGEVTNAILNDVVAKSLICGWKSGPKYFQITQDAAINWNHPVIREVFVANFAHLWLSCVKDHRTERQKCEDYCSLSTQRDTPVDRVIAIHRLHIVNIVIFHWVYETFNQYSINFESIEELSRILFRYFLLLCNDIVLIASRFAKGNNVGSELWSWPSHVPDVTGNDSFPCNAGYESI